MVETRWLGTSGHWAGASARPAAIVGPIEILPPQAEPKAARSALRKACSPVARH